MQKLSVLDEHDDEHYDEHDDEHDDEHNDNDDDDKDENFYKSKVMIQLCIEKRR